MRVADDRVERAFRADYWREWRRISLPLALGLIVVAAIGAAIDVWFGAWPAHFLGRVEGRLEALHVSESDTGTIADASIRLPDGTLASVHFPRGVVFRRGEIVELAGVSYDGPFPRRYYQFVRYVLTEGEPAQ